MSRWNSSSRTLGFGALAAAGLPVAVTFAGPLIGNDATVRLYLIAAAGIYGIGLGGDRSRRFAALAFAAFAAVVLALLPIGLRGTAVGAAGIVAFARSGLLQRQAPLRALAIEGALAALGLAAAAFLASGGLLALCLGIWGYFLVQSAYFLIGGHGPRASETSDPFERARARLERLLED